MSLPAIHTFEEAFQQAKASPTCYGKRRLLLGNGFSMACYGDFGYSTLYQKVHEKGIPEKVQNIFQKYGETNFEAILKLLDDASWMAQNYDLYEDESASQMRLDYEALKEALTNAITEVHPEHRGVIANEKYDSAHTFIVQFDEIYSVNYDLLLYWCSLHVEPFKFKDYFSKDEDTNGNDCEFMPHINAGDSHIYFLHGALHLYSDGESIRKRVWKDTSTPLVTQIRAALDRKEYPLVVAEGSSHSKMAQIHGSSYLSNCLRKFNGIKGHLFTFGHSMSDQDSHLIESIVKNGALRHLWIGIRGDFTKPSNKHLYELGESMKARRIEHTGEKKQNKSRGPLYVHFYDANSANVWS